MENCPDSLERQLETALTEFREGMFSDRPFFSVIANLAGLSRGITAESPEVANLYCEPAGELVDPDNKRFEYYVKFGFRYEEDPKFLHIFSVTGQRVGNKVIKDPKASPDLEKAYNNAGVRYSAEEGVIVLHRFLGSLLEMKAKNPGLACNITLGRYGYKFKEPQELSV